MMEFFLLLTKNNYFGKSLTKKEDKPIIEAHINILVMPKQRKEKVEKIYLDTTLVPERFLITGKFDETSENKIKNNNLHKMEVECSHYF